MTEHKPLPVAGYTSQSERNVDLVNWNKKVEEELLQLLDRLEALAETDKRWLAIGRTHIQEGFMAINRSIFKPRRPTIEEMGPSISLD